MHCTWKNEMKQKKNFKRFFFIQVPTILWKRWNFLLSTWEHHISPANLLYILNLLPSVNNISKTPPTINLRNPGTYVPLFSWEPSSLNLLPPGNVISLGNLLFWTIYLLGTSYSVFSTSLKHHISPVYLLFSTFYLQETSYLQGTSYSQPSTSLEQYLLKTSYSLAIFYLLETSWLRIHPRTPVPPTFSKLPTCRNQYLLKTSFLPAPRNLLLPVNLSFSRTS